MDVYFIPIRSGVCENVNDPGGGGGGGVAIPLSSKTITFLITTIKFIVRVCFIDLRLQNHLLLH